MKHTLISFLSLLIILSYSQSCRKPSANNRTPKTDTCILKTVSYGLLPEHLENNFTVKYENGKIVSLTSAKYLITYQYNTSQHLKRKEKFLKSNNERIAAEEFVTNSEGLVTEQFDTIFLAEVGYQKSISRCVNIHTNNQLVEKRFFDRYNNLKGINIFRWNNNNIVAISRYYDNQLVDSLQILYDSTKPNKLTNNTLQFIIQDIAPGSATQFQFPLDIIQISSQQLISKINYVNGLSNDNISYLLNSKGYINNVELNGASYWRFTYGCD